MTGAAEAMRGTRVLVTGARGFLGANIVWALCEHGFAVRALLRRPAAGPQWEGLKGVEFIQGDVRDRAAMDRAVAGVGAVIHTAGRVQVVPHPRGEAFAVNVGGTRTVCAAALAAGVRRLVFTSSASGVTPGTAEHPATEDSPDNLGPIRAPYYDSKRRAEQVVREFRGRGLETITLLPGYVIGPRDVRPTTNELLLYAARSRWPLLPPGGGNVIDVREVALAHVRALWLGEPGQRYLLAGPYRAYAELAAAARRVVGAPGTVYLIPRWARAPASVFLALLAGVWPGLPDGLSVPGFRYGFVGYHVSGARADRAFGLTHRPPEESVFDALCWFRDAGLAPWLPRRLYAPGEAPANGRPPSSA